MITKRLIDRLRRERAIPTDKERRIVDAAIRWRERERVGLTTASAREELANACDAMTEEG